MTGYGTPFPGYVFMRKTVRELFIQGRTIGVIFCSIIRDRWNQLKISCGFFFVSDTEVVPVFSRSMDWPSSVKLFEPTLVYYHLVESDTGLIVIKRFYSLCVELCFIFINQGIIFYVVWGYDLRRRVRSSLFKGAT